MEGVAFPFESLWRRKGSLASEGGSKSYTTYFLEDKWVPISSTMGRLQGKLHIGSFDALLLALFGSI